MAHNYENHNLTPGKAGCTKQMSCAPGYSWSWRYCNCMEHNPFFGSKFDTDDSNTPHEPVSNDQKDCIQQMSCAPGHTWSQRHCNCMTYDEISGPYFKTATPGGNSPFDGRFVGKDGNIVVIWPNKSANPNGSNEVELNRRNAQGQVAPAGFHYMPDGTLMSDVEHTTLITKPSLNPGYPPSSSPNSVYVDPANFDCSDCMNVVAEHGYVFNPVSHTHTRAVGWQQAGWSSGELAKNGQNFYQKQIHLQNNVFDGRSILHFHLSSNCNVSLVRDIPYPFSTQHNKSVGDWITGSGMCYTHTGLDTAGNAAGNSDALVLGSTTWNNQALQWYNSQSGSSSPIPLNMGGLWLTKVGIPAPNAPAGTPLYLAPFLQTVDQIAGDLVYIPSDNSFVGSFGNNNGGYVRHFKAPQGNPSGTIPQAVNLGTDWWPGGSTAYSMWSNGDDVYARRVLNGPGQNFKFDLSSHTLIPSNVSSIGGGDVASSPVCVAGWVCDYAGMMVIGMQPTLPGAQSASPGLYVIYDTMLNNTAGYYDFLDDMWDHFTGVLSGPTGCDWWLANWNDWNWDYTGGGSVPLITDPTEAALWKAKIDLAWQMLNACGCDEPGIAQKIAKPGDTTRKVTKRGNKKIDGWVLMPSGSYITETEFKETYNDGSSKVITELKLNLSDLTATTETRSLEVKGSNNAEFILEVKNAAGDYYNFHTQTFASSHSVLEEELVDGLYIDEIVFPASGSDDQYDIFLHAKVGTKHIPYTEKRFEDDSIDLNGSIGSNSLLMQKIIYQYNSELTLTLSGYSPGGGISGVFGNVEIDIDRHKSQDETAFSFITTAGATAAFRILKQPLESDVIAFIEPVIGSAPIDLPGENIYPTATAAFTGDDVNGAVTSGSVVRVDNTDLSAVIAVGDKITTTTTGDTVDGAVTSGVRIVMDTNVATKMAVGDQVTVDGNSRHFFNTNQVLVTHLDPDGDNAKEFQIDAVIQDAEVGGVLDGEELVFSSKINRSLTTVTVVETSGTATDFTMSQAIQFRDNAPLTFFPRMNFSWPVNNYVNLIEEGMIVVTGAATNVTANTKIQAYIDKVTTLAGTKGERVRVNKILSALNKKGKKPTVVKGLVTNQAGNITFNNQQVLALAGDTLRIGGYGESKILRMYGWDVELTDLKITLTAPTTTTREATSAHAVIDVNSKEGVINNVSRVGGIGINSALQNPLITAGGGATGTGDWTMDAVQTLESGITLTVENTGRIATITGNIRILKAGTASQTLRFDVDKLLSTSAP